MKKGAFDEINTVDPYKTLEGAASTLGRPGLLISPATVKEEEFSQVVSSGEVASTVRHGKV